MTQKTQNSFKHTGTRLGGKGRKQSCGYTTQDRNTQSSFACTGARLVANARSSPPATQPKIVTHRAALSTGTRLVAKAGSSAGSSSGP